METGGPVSRSMFVITAANECVCVFRTLVDFFFRWSLQQIPEEGFGVGTRPAGTAPIPLPASNPSPEPIDQINTDRPDSSTRTSLCSVG